MSGRHKRDIPERGKKNIALKKKELCNLSHQYYDEFAQFTLSSLIEIFPTKKITFKGWVDDSVKATRSI